MARLRRCRSRTCRRRRRAARIAAKWHPRSRERPRPRRCDRAAATGWRARRPSSRVTRRTRTGWPRRSPAPGRRSSGWSGDRGSGSWRPVRGEGGSARWSRAPDRDHRPGARPGLPASGIVQHRQLGLRNQRVAAGAGVWIGRRIVGAAAERVDREDDERRGGDERRGQHAARRPRRGAAKAEAHQRPRTARRSAAGRGPATTPRARAARPRAAPLRRRRTPPSGWPGRGNPRPAAPGPPVPTPTPGASAMRAGRRGLPARRPRRQPSAREGAPAASAARRRAATRRHRRAP